MLRERRVPLVTREPGNAHEGKAACSDDLGTQPRFMKFRDVIATVEKYYRSTICLISWITRSYKGPTKDVMKQFDRGKKVSNELGDFIRGGRTDHHDGSGNRFARGFATGQSTRP